METTKHPYELLVRWDQTGKLSGVQMQYRYVIRDGEKIVGESVGNAEPLSLDKGFPLQDVLTAAQADALATAEAAKIKVADLEAALAMERSAVADLRNAIHDLRAQLKAASANAAAHTAAVETKARRKTDLDAHAKRRREGYVPMSARD